MNTSNLQTRFQLVFDGAGNKVRLPLAEIWQLIVDHLHHFKSCPPKMNLHTNSAEGDICDYSKLTPEQIHERLVVQEYGGFITDTNHLLTTFSIWLSTHRFTLHPPTLAVVATPGEKFPSSWKNLIEQLAALHPIRIAKQYEFLYSRWQNTIRLDLWKEAWGQVPAYKRTTKTIPSADITHTWLDISQNPGRSVDSELNHYFVAAEMWLGPGFWSYASCTKEEVLAADFFIEKRDTPHYLYLKSWPHPFTRPDGEQGRVQQKLWRLLYKQDCEWPPGSGGISDVPVGGPPELMP
ncbi:MAG: hypothetical protein U1F81_19140 [Verrucomicrobiaceae bacterium]